MKITLQVNVRLELSDVYEKLRVRDLIERQIQEMWIHETKVMKTRFENRIDQYLKNIENENQNK